MKNPDVKYFLYSIPGFLNFTGQIFSGALVLSTSRHLKSQSELNSWTDDADY